MRSKNDNCSDCKFSNIDRKALICRRYPPKLMNMQRVNPVSKQVEIASVAMYPQVTDKIGPCGEYVMKSNLSPVK